jgi:hypothetical protein
MIRRTRGLTPIEIALVALLLWGILTPHMGCSG